MMSCREVRQMLPAYGGDPQDSLSLRRHLAVCAGCRAEADRYSLLMGALRDLKGSAVDPPEALLESLIAIPGRGGRIESVRTHVTRNRKVYVGGAVLVAGAAGAALWRTRIRRAA